MTTLGRFAVFAILSASVGAHAGDGADGDEQQDAAVKPESEQELNVPKYSPNQILCVKQRREGSRVKQTKCQTLADWKLEIDLKDMRRSMIRARGKAAAWELSP